MHADTAAAGDTWIQRLPPACGCWGGDGSISSPYHCLLCLKGDWIWRMCFPLSLQVPGGTLNLRSKLFRLNDYRQQGEGPAFSWQHQHSSCFSGESRRCQSWPWCKTRGTSEGPQSSSSPCSSCLLSASQLPRIDYIILSYFFPLPLHLETPQSSINSGKAPNLPGPIYL